MCRRLGGECRRQTIWYPQQLHPSRDYGVEFGMDDNLLKNIWSQESYYQKIAQSEDFSHPGFKRIEEGVKNATSILDVGCGDGSKLARLGGKKTQRTGVDVSSKALALAGKKFPQMSLRVSGAEKLPFDNDEFELVTCLFVLEHTQDPERVIKEIVRVVRPAGKIYLLAPNFGAPNRASPNYRRSRLIKLITGLVADFTSNPRLSWQKVTPRIRTIEQFQSDLDTTVEPYLGSLIKFLARQPVRIHQTSSFWQMERGEAKFIQKIFRFFGARGVYPFKYWGPHLFVVAQK